ncbi:conjugal transfer protein TraX [Neobacillus mesonae]|nr:conjugal transfer protein TraX [Neobacillus mesonae]
MLIDHIGAVFFPEETVLRIIGRIAFPVYAFSIFLGYIHTRNVKRYTFRLFIIAIISQVPFMLAFNQATLNVVWTLLASLLVLQALDKVKNAFVSILIVIAAGLIMEVSTMDYGIYGLLLVLIYRYTEGYVMVFAHLLLNIVDLVQSQIQIWSTFSTVFIAFALHKGVSFRSTVPRWLWTSFYPLHLAIIGILRVYRNGGFLF